MAVSELREFEGTLSSGDNKSVVSALQQLTYRLPKYSENDLVRDSTAEQTEFLHSHYYRHLVIIFECMNSSWDGLLSSEDEKQFLDSYVLKGNQSEALIALLQTISESSLSYKLSKCVNLLESFITTDCIAALILDHCIAETSQYRNRREVLQDEIITRLVSLPERLANKLQNNNRDNFLPGKYFKLLSANILLALSTVHSALKNDQNCCLTFISTLIGRCCVVGHADEVLSNLIPHLINHTKEDFIWRRICHRLFCGVPDNALENMLVKMIKFLPHPKYMTCLLGDAMLKNNKMQLLLTQKLLFMRSFENDLALRNILGYIADSEKDSVTLMKVFTSLMAIWGDKSAIKHVSYDQHSYITRALLVSGGLLKNSNVDFNSLKNLTSGVTNHIHSPHSAVRRLGMITAKTLIPILDPSGTNIEFEFEIDDEVKRLQKLVHPLEEHDINDLNSCETIDLKSVCNETKLSSEPKLHSESKQIEILDSDDEDDDGLIAYDMSADTVKSKFKKPAYVRDCMEGLVEQNNPEKVEVCLQTAEELILNEGESTLEVAVEFSKILLHLTNECGTDNFRLLREKALIALLMKSPIDVSRYLTREFYDRNYSLSQRLDILEALSTAAQQLSMPPKASKKREVTEHDAYLPANPTNSAEDWRSIVQRRIDSKTRRFGKGPQKQLFAIENQFAPVAGHFFFPLMSKYDKRENALDLLGEDCMVLGRLLYTLGIVMYSAVNAPMLPQMGKTLLSFIWALRYHTETYVRRALLFCLSIIVATLPSHTIVTDLQDDIIEFSHWAKDILQDDVDVECQQLAATVTKSLANTFNEAFSPTNGE